MVGSEWREHDAAMAMWVPPCSRVGAAVAAQRWGDVDVDVDHGV
jgi:hypothetical protein